MPKSELLGNSVNTPKRPMIVPQKTTIVPDSTLIVPIVPSKFFDCTLTGFRKKRSPKFGAGLN